MIRLRDNSRYSEGCARETSDKLSEVIGALDALANRSIKEIKAEGWTNVLFYPHSFAECADDLGAQELFRIRRKPMEVRTLNVAGFLSVPLDGGGRRSIRIGSRFTAEGADHFLYYMLLRVQGLNVHQMQYDAPDEASGLDLLMLIFPQMLLSALGQGLYKEYMRRQYNDARVRGAIDVSRHIRYNIPFNGRIAYSVREYSFDNPVMELIRHTIEYLQSRPLSKALLSSNREIRDAVRLVVDATPSYKRADRQSVMRACRRPIHHPYFGAYRSLQGLCLQILDGQDISFSDVRTDRAIRGVLIDVAWLWEEYLAVVLRGKMAGMIHAENKKRRGAIYLSEAKADGTKRKRFPRYPDFYRTGANALALDAKYKRKIDTRLDVNQVITYMTRLKAKKGGFVLPYQGNESLWDDDEMRGDDLTEGYKLWDDLVLTIHRVEVPSGCRSLEEFADAMREREEKLCAELQKLDPPTG